MTPSFNQGDFIDQTIQSVLTQSYDRVEYFVADGGSTDSTHTYLQKWMKKYQGNKKFSFVSEPDKGQTNAINKGIEHFKQRIKQLDLNPKEVIFAYLNSDDYYAHNLVLSLVAKKMQHLQNQVWLTGDYSIDSSKNGWFHTILISGWKKLLKKFYSWPLLLVVNPLAQPSTFIRFDALLNTGLFNEDLNMVMDYEYWLRLQQKFGSPIFINQVLSVFRIHNLSKGGRQFEKQFREQYQVAKRFTQNKWLLKLHFWHNKLTVLGYNQVK